MSQVTVATLKAKATRRGVAINAAEAPTFWLATAVRGWQCRRCLLAENMALVPEIEPLMYLPYAPRFCPQ